VNIKVRKNIDAMYCDTLQKERWADKSQDYPTIDQRFLKDKKFSKTSLLHPLPRVGSRHLARQRPPCCLLPPGRLSGCPSAWP
jgi:aspartate carbamoyltransferase catalytic subunit